MKVYFDWREMGKSAVVCNCCGRMWSGEPTAKKGLNGQARDCERVANKNGWLIIEEKNFHVCDLCAEKMVNHSYCFSIKPDFEDRNK